MLRLVVLLLCALIGLVCGQTTDVSKCISNPGDLPINVYVAGCPAPTTPCLLPQLQDAVIDIVFRAPRTMRSMTTLATAYLNIGITVPIPYDLRENSITCNFLKNSYCPVVEGEVVEYQLRMYIESIFPKNTQVTIEFRIVDENRDPVMCLRTAVKIAPPLDQNTYSEKNHIDESAKTKLNLN